MARFELWQDEMMVAVVECSDLQRAWADICHYAIQYVQEGPVEIREVSSKRAEATR